MYWIHEHTNPRHIFSNTLAISEQQMLGVVEYRNSNYQMINMVYCFVPYLIVNTKLDDIAFR